MHSFGPSSEEGGRIPLTHSKRAPRANLQYRVVLPNVMLALFLKKASSFFFFSLAPYCSSTATFSAAWPSLRPLL